MEKARLFQNGGSQAVRLPIAYRLPGTEVYVRKLGNAVVLIPVEGSWDSLFDSLDLFPPDFMESREEPPLDLREEPFE